MRAWARPFSSSSRLALLLLTAALAAGCGRGRDDVNETGSRLGTSHATAGGSRRGEIDAGRQARAAAARDSLTAALRHAEEGLAWAEGELRAARGSTAYLVLDAPGNILRLKLAGVAFDSLQVESISFHREDADSLRRTPWRRISSVENTVVRAGRLEADTTVDKAAAVLARYVPPRAVLLRQIVHADGVDVRFTAADPAGLRDELRVFFSRSFGTRAEPPMEAEGAAPPSRSPIRVDVKVAGSDLSRLDHFVEKGMPLLLRFGPE